MTFTVLLYSFIASISALPYDGWIKETGVYDIPPTPPALVGHDASSNTLWLLGGVNSHTSAQLTSYDYETKKFTDHGLTALPNGIQDDQPYAQIGSLLYVTDDVYTSYINVFNMATQTLETNAASLQRLSSDSCFVNIRDEYLAVLLPDGSVEILNVDTNVWLDRDSIPLLQEGRYGSACAYANDMVFSIGGQTLLGVGIDTIEYLDVSSDSLMNLTYEEWEYTNHSLPVDISYGRAVVVNDDILVIGGLEADIVLEWVFVIESLSGYVYLGGYLAKAVYSSAVIYANDAVYSFGGIGAGDEPWNGWQVHTFISTTGYYTTETTEEPDSAQSSRYAMIFMLIYLKMFYILFC